MSLGYDSTGALLCFESGERMKRVALHGEKQSSEDYGGGITARLGWGRAADPQILAPAERCAFVLCPSPLLPLTGTFLGIFSCS